MDGKQSAIRLGSNHRQSTIPPKEGLDLLDAFLLGPPADKDKQISAWILIQVGPLLRLSFETGLSGFEFLVNGNVRSLDLFFIPFSSVCRIWVGKGSHFVNSPENRIPCE